MDQEIEVPSFFLCPVSLEIMKDPVTVSTGITYDRDSIEKWLFSNKSNTCPVTKQVLIGYELTPNHTLRRMIQFWCTLNASRGIERIPTPKPPATKSQIEKLVKEAKSNHQRLGCVIKKLRLVASENATNKRCIEEAGVPEFLTSIIRRFEDEDMSGTAKSTLEEALSLLYNLQISETGFKNLLERNGSLDIIRSLAKILQRGSYESRVYAVLLMKSLVEVADPTRVPLSNLNPELFSELVRILKDQISQQASKAVLQTMIIVCPHGRNRQKAVAAGAVRVLIEFLASHETYSKNKRMVEMEMTALEQLCQCAEGRSEFVGHALGIAVVAKKTMRVSKAASERAVGILASVGRFCGTPWVVEEMLELGVAAKMCLVLQSDLGSKTRERARELLRLHSRVWRASPCVPLLASI